MVQAIAKVLGRELAAWFQEHQVDPSGWGGKGTCTVVGVEVRGSKESRAGRVCGFNF